MSNITEVSVQKKNTERFNLFLDEKFACGLSADTVVKFGLYKGKEITNAEFDEIVWAEFINYCFRKAADYSTQGIKSEKAVRNYLFKLLAKKQKLIDVFGQAVVEKLDKKAVIEEVLAKVKELGLVSDSVFAEEFVNSRLLYKPRGKRMLENELMQRGVSKDEIKAALSKFNVDEKTMIAELLQKKYNKTRLTYADKKEINYLRGKGFDWDEISSFIDD